MKFLQKETENSEHIKFLQKETENLRSSIKFLKQKNYLDTNIFDRLREYDFIINETCSLEDLLNIIHKKAGSFVKLYKRDNLFIVGVERMRQDGTTGGWHDVIEASSEKSFINAAGQWILNALEKGIKGINADNLFEIGFNTTEYHIKSNLLNEGSWMETMIKRNFEKISIKPKKSVFCVKCFLRKCNNK